MALTGASSFAAAFFAAGFFAAFALGAFAYFTTTFAPTAAPIFLSVSASRKFWRLIQM